MNHVDPIPGVPNVEASRVLPCSARCLVAPVTRGGRRELGHSHAAHTHSRGRTLLIEPQSVGFSLQPQRGLRVARAREREREREREEEREHTARVGCTSQRNDAPFVCRGGLKEGGGAV